MVSSTYGSGAAWVLRSCCGWSALWLFLYASFGRAQPGIELLSREVARFLFEIKFRLKPPDDGPQKGLKLFKKKFGKATKRGLETD